MNDFNDRTSWLAYRADWRIRYRQASEDIRDTKREIARHRALRREFGPEADGHRHAADGMQCGLGRQRRYASALMRELDAAKERKAAMLAEKLELAAA